MGHLAGLIQGNPVYDAQVQLINGTPTFVGNGFSATLTPSGSPVTYGGKPSFSAGLTRDGNHLDPRLHPFDLMNTTPQQPGKAAGQAVRSYSHQG
jgi:hypothetical protein